MPSRQYFYKDSKGKVHKFAYCCICGAGPFKQSEKNYNFISTGNRQELSYCTRCYRNLGMKSENLFDKSHMATKETVEAITFQHDAVGDVEVKKEINIKKDKQDPVRYDEVYEIKEKDSEPVKKIVKEEPDRIGDFFVYMGQFDDGSYKVDITENIEKEVENINFNKKAIGRKLPFELIYYHKVNSWKQALFDKDQMNFLTTPQKEELSRKFIEELFKEEKI